jgi:indolepyruvate ferredoxin oxidoreductase, alpha subunit
VAERSFAREVESLRLGAGETFEGEAILAVTKALLQAGVAYVGGYQGAPVSHLMDVLADARSILDELGVRFESSASEATAAAMLAASVNYPIRGAVTWKSTVGTNVASDALSNLASAGVTGGALIVLGEDYGEGASIMQERTHAFAMKSQMWLLDPRPDLPAIVRMVEQGFELSEASSTPVMLMMRIRACHMHGRFVASDNRRPAFTVADALAAPRRSYDRIILPPSTYQQEREKIDKRWPAAVEFVARHALNERHDGDLRDIGIVLQGGLYNTLLRALERLGLADVFGASQVPLYVLNVTYPLVPAELTAFAEGKRALLVVEEGQPEYLEQSIGMLLRQAGLATEVIGKGPFPRAGEYTGAVVRQGLEAFVERYRPEVLRPAVRTPEARSQRPVREQALLPAAVLAGAVPARPSGLCTGCPERPLFTAMKLIERERGPLHVSADIGCHSFATLPPFDLGASIMGYGLGAAGAAALENGSTGARPVALMGDGGFWHNGLTSGIGNAVFNRHDGVTIIVDNGYSAATGGQYVLSSRADVPDRKLGNPIEKAVRGVGVNWVRRVHTYDMKATLGALREALSTSEPGPKVVIAEGECQLSRQRRVAPQLRRRIEAGQRTVQQKFGVDENVCTGDHSCIRLSGCPSLTVKPSSDPLRSDPVAHVDNSCVGCGVCGEVAHAAVLCPSFYRADVIENPTRLDRLLARVRARVIGWLAGRPELRWT